MEPIYFKHTLNKLIPILSQKSEKHNLLPFYHFSDRVPFIWRPYAYNAIKASMIYFTELLKEIFFQTFIRF